MFKKEILKVNTNEHDMLSCIRELKKFTDKSEYEIRVEEIKGVHYFTVLQEEMKLEKTSWMDKIKGMFTSDNTNKNENIYIPRNESTKNTSSWKDSIKYNVEPKNTYPRNYNNYSNTNYQSTNRYGYYDSGR